MNLVNSLLQMGSLSQLNIVEGSKGRSGPNAGMITGIAVVTAAVVSLLIDFFLIKKKNDDSDK